MPKQHIFCENFANYLPHTDAEIYPRYMPDIQAHKEKQTKRQHIGLVKESQSYPWEPLNKTSQATTRATDIFTNFFEECFSFYIISNTKTH